MGGTARRPILPYVVGAIGLVLMVGVSEYAAKKLSVLFGRRSAVGAEVGRMESGHGTINRVRGAERSVHDDDDSRQVLIDGDRVETGAEAEATLTLNSQDELVVGPKSVVAFELWNERDANSPVYVHVIAGNVTSKRAGVRGRAYVVRDGRLFLPGQKPGVKQAPMVITRDAGAAVSFGPEGSLEARAKDEAFEAPAKARADEPETLANEYVEEMIASRQSQLQKCWLSRLKDKPKLAGKLTVQFEINRRGKVREASVVDSSLDDAQLGQCVTTVVERIPFRSFTGPEISIAYPITFE